MYKVLLADDEEIIREGIGSIIEWESFDTFFIGSAGNGKEAYEIIVKNQPDILITDLKMPEMGGLELTKKIRENFPDVSVVILSGYGEFEFAQQAMQYGVRHYLLKPCNEEEIKNVILKIISEKKQKERVEQFYANLKASLDKVLPSVLEQFVKDFSSGRFYSKNDLEFFGELLKISEEDVVLVLFSTEKDCSFEKKFALKNIIEDVFKKEIFFPCTINGDNVMLLLKATEISCLTAQIKYTRREFRNYYDSIITTSISGSGSFWDLPQLYNEAQECLKYRFYLGEGGIITKNDIELGKGQIFDAFAFNYEKIVASVKSGNIKELNEELDTFFNKINFLKCEINLAKTYCIELLSIVIRQCNQEKLGLYVSKTVELDKAATLEQISLTIKSVACEIAKSNFDYMSSKMDIILKAVINSVNENISNEGLSLSWIAKKIMYMNEDYLGQIFKKGTGEKFSAYVMKLRMEKARQLLDGNGRYKTYEIADKTGFGKNPQYFSQVFKKYFGCSPTEYKKKDNGDYFL